MLVRRSAIISLPLLTQVIGCGAFGPPLPVVESVDLAQYAGKWYEIASYPTSFQAGCTGTTAEYTLRNDGTVEVVNTCYLNALDGPVNRIVGSARVADPQTGAKLKVRFFPLFEADYWIIDLGENYEYAVVSHPNRQFLWILSRTPSMGDGTYEQIVSRLPDLGLDPARLVRTLQPDSGD